MRSLIARTHQESSSQFPWGESRGSLLVHPTVLAFAVRLSTVASVFALQAILASNLGAARYGHYAYAIAWVTAILPFALLGFDKGTSRFAAQYRASEQWSLLKSYSHYSIRIVIAAATIATIAMITVIPAIAKRAASDLDTTLYFAALLFIPLALCELFQSSLRAQGQMAKGFSGKLIFSGVFTFLVLGSGASFGVDFSASHAILLHLIAATIAVTVAGHWARRALPTGSVTQSRSVLRKLWLGTSIPFTAIALLHFLKGHFTILICGHLLS